ncbi:MAG: cytidylyltransferase [Omnitrophica WOR_2 bacterium RIFCSPHIGHO2_01_FULL_48_9]|nr:MAG: cytidylyltransferase [Omnitrophica WOR_2 bacterium RIFCSPHIGHO2_01_FULL_48_9]
MVSALLIGRKGSIGFPGKNVYPILGRPLSFYPMDAAKKAKLVDRVFISTDCEQLMQLARENGVEIIERPAHLCTKTALGEHVFVHGFEEITKRVGTQEMIALLHCNSATVTAEIIDEGVRALREKPLYDSAVSVSKYNMWSPLRARKIGPDGLLHPFVPFETFGDPKTLNCDRDSQGDVYFADMGLSIVRPRCLEHLEEGLLPQKWMGQKIYPLIQEGGCDVDYEFQIAQTEHWIKKNLNHR